MYVEPLYMAAEKGPAPQLKRVIVGFGDRIAMEETLDGAIARVFEGRCRGRGPRWCRVPGSSAGSVKALLDDAAPVLTRADEELRRLNELSRRLREVEQGPESRAGQSILWVTPMSFDRGRP